MVNPVLFLLAIGCVLTQSVWEGACIWSPGSYYCVDTSEEDCTELTEKLNSILNESDWEMAPTSGECTTIRTCTSDLSCFNSTESFCKLFSKTYRSSYTWNSTVCASTNSTIIIPAFPNFSICSRADLVTCNESNPSNITAYTLPENVEFNSIILEPLHNFVVQNKSNFTAIGNLSLTNFTLVVSGARMNITGDLDLSFGQIILQRGSLFVGGVLRLSGSQLFLDGNSTIFIAKNLTSSQTSPIWPSTILTSGGKINISGCANFRNIYFNFTDWARFAGTTPGATILKKVIAWKCLVSKLNNSVCDRTLEYDATGMNLLFPGVTCNAADLEYLITMNITVPSSMPRETFIAIIKGKSLESLTIKSQLLIKVDAHFDDVHSNETFSIYSIEISFIEGVADILLTTLGTIAENIEKTFTMADTVAKLKEMQIFLDPNSVKLIIKQKTSVFVPVVAIICVIAVAACFISSFFVVRSYNAQKKLLVTIPLDGDLVSDSCSDDNPLLASDGNNSGTDTDDDDRGDRHGINNHTNDDGSDN